MRKTIPSSYEHSRYNATARGVEMLAQHVRWRENSSWSTAYRQSR
jgi:hypothetical protein